MTVPITLTNLTSLQNQTTAINEINSNSAAITTAFESALDTSGDQMQGNIDMNNGHILNLPAPSTADEPLRLQDLIQFNGGGSVTNLPSGGTTGQVLAKNSNTNYDVKWSNSVTSVGLAMPADLTVTNSPVTTTGTLTANWATTPTGSGAMVRATSPTLVTPILGTPTSGTLTNCTGLPATSITGTGLPISTLATEAANTFVGNSTTSTASPTAFTMGSLTTKASPVSGDQLIIADSAASGALKVATVGTIASAGSVSSIAGNTGAFTLTKGITNTVNAIGLSLTNATFQSTSLAPTGTTSASFVMMGLGSTCTLTPTYSTRVMLEFNGVMSNSAASSVLAKMYFGTGVAPSNGAAVTGTNVGAQQNATTTAGGFVPLSNGAIITGLTPGTAYWFDMAIAAGSGTASLPAVACTAMEF